VKKSRAAIASSVDGGIRKRSMYRSSLMGASVVAAAIVPVIGIEAVVDGVTAACCAAANPVASASASSVRESL